MRQWSSPAITPLMPLPLLIFTFKMIPTPLPLPSPPACIIFYPSPSSVACLLSTSSTVHTLFPSSVSSSFPLLPTHFPLLSPQCRIAASKGNQVLGMIQRNITYRDRSLIVPLCKAIVIPHLEYCIHAWSPYLRIDIYMLEKIQRRATKLISGLRDLSYEERLKEYGLTTLETRRLMGVK